MLEREDPVNWSTLKAIVESPKLYRWRLDHPLPDTEARLLGRLTHCAVYEPSMVDKRFCVEPNFHGGMLDANAKLKGYDGGRESKAAWAESHKDMEIVSVDLYTRAYGMRAALMADPIAGPMIAGGFAEQMFGWVDPITDIACRGRIDHVNGQLSDLKTCRSVNPRSFNADVARYSYHAQLAWYADGLEANGIVLDEPPAIVAVESEQPHDVLVLEFSEEDLAAGRALYRRCLDKLAECRALDRWPGVADGRRQRLALPRWVMPEPELELTLGGVALEI